MRGRGRPVRRASAIPLALVAVIGVTGCRRFPEGDWTLLYARKGFPMRSASISSGSFPAGIPITVDDKDWKAVHGIGGIGRIADAALFADPRYPLFKVLIAFSCARPTLFGYGEYADPRSIWYNVFLGFYQIDAPSDRWQRPFGYNPDGTVAFEDIVRLGKADWNYFSNHVYGVPLKYSQMNDALDSDMVTSQGQPVQIGGFLWDPIDIQNVKTVSTYWSGQGEKLETFNPLLTPFWRASFGVHDPVPGHTESFFTTRMHARAYVCHSQTRDGTAFRTFAFGGTVRQGFPNQAESEQFLDLQMAAIRKVMALIPPLVDCSKPNNCCPGSR